MTSSRLAEQLVALKRGFAKKYDGRSHIQEVIPLELPGVRQDHMSGLHDFARRSPIYYRSYDDVISGLPCVVYEGDINEYWLGSIKNDSSTQPFYPTWITSAYALALGAAELRCDTIIDIGAGDGRIAYCGRLVGLNSCALEIDSALVDLQRHMIDSTGIYFDARMADATEFDYARLTAGRAALFVGGLAQMGGDILASAVLDRTGPSCEACMILAGSYAKRYLSTEGSHAGWGQIISKYRLRVIKKLTLPTVWTFDQPDETPYIFVSLR